ncbi:ATP-binding protein [Acidobacteriota bacterium]
MPRFRTLSLHRSFFVVFLFLLIPLSAVHGQTFQDKEQTVFRLTEGWKYRWGDSPMDERGTPQWTLLELDSKEWKQAASLGHPRDRRGRETIWLRCQIPSNSPASLSLFIPRVFLKLQVFIENKLIHSYGQPEFTHQTRSNTFQPQLISLPDDVQGKNLFLKIQSKSLRYIGIEEPVLLGEEKAVLLLLIRNSLTFFILGLFCVLAGLMAFTAYLNHDVRKTYSVLCFGLFSVSIGAGFVSTQTAAQVLVSAPSFWYYLLFLSFLVFPPALVAFVDLVISRGFMSIARRLWQFHILHGCLAIILELTGIMPLVQWQTYLQYIWIIDILVVMGISIHAALKGNIEARIFTIGLGFFSLFALVDLLRMSHSTSLMPFGTFIFILILGWMLFRKSMENSRQLRVYSKELEAAKEKLEDYSHTLEEKVEKRTLELQQKNEQLQQAFHELEEAQQQLIMREKMASLGNLVAGVAHEINNPVGAVHSAADVSRRSIDKIMEMLESGKTLEEIKKNPRFDQTYKILMDNLNIGLMATERISTIVKSLRKFVRLDESEFKDTDIHECLEDTLTLISHELKDRVSVVREFGQIPIIQTYPSELNQVFMNLLINASQAIEGNGTIHVSTRADEGWIYIDITDSGKGIRPENLSKIFDPGFTTKGVGVGTGLGLSICYSIIQKHKGEITASSEVEKGSTFTIKLPLKVSS